MRLRTWALGALAAATLAAPSAASAITLTFDVNLTSRFTSDEYSLFDGDDEGSSFHSEPISTIAFRERVRISDLVLQPPFMNDDPDFRIFQNYAIGTARVLGSNR